MRRISSVTDYRRISVLIQRINQNKSEYTRCLIINDRIVHWYTIYKIEHENSVQKILYQKFLNSFKELIKKYQWIWERKKTGKTFQASSHLKYLKFVADEDCLGGLDSSEILDNYLKLSIEKFTKQ